FFFGGSQSLGGNATVTLGPSSINFVGATASGTTLTVGPDISIHATGGALGGGGTTFVNQNTITVDVGSSNVTINGLDNHGAVDVSGGANMTLAGAWTNRAGATITVTDSTLNLGGTYSNLGDITADNSTVNLGGAFTLAGLGSFHRTAGTVNLTGSLDNAN